MVRCAFEYGLRGAEMTLMGFGEGDGWLWGVWVTGDVRGVWWAKREGEYS